MGLAVCMLFTIWIQINYQLTSPGKVDEESKTQARIVLACIRGNTNNHWNGQGVKLLYLNDYNIINFISCSVETVKELTLK